MFDSFLAGGLCGCLLTTLAGYYFAMRFKRASSRRRPVQTCTRAYFPRKYAFYDYDEPHAVHVRHIFLSSLLLSEQEKSNLGFLRWQIEKGLVSEEI